MDRIKINLPEKLLFSTEITLRISDINYGGHMGNDVVLSLVHEARIRFLNSLGFSESNIDGAGMIMFDAAVQYKSQAFYGTTLLIEVGIENIIRSGCDFLYRITNKVSGTEIARAKTGLAFFDYQNNKMIAVPDKFKASLIF